MSDKETAPTPEKFWEKWAEANPKDAALMASPNRWFKFAEAFAVECRAPAPQIERFGDWCDMKGIEPTMGQVDAFVREQVRAATPQVTPTERKYEALYAEARESLCSCNHADPSAEPGSSMNYTCEWCEKHPGRGRFPANHQAPLCSGGRTGET